MIAKVVAMHERIKGRTPAGESYHASDPELLRWVHATAGFGFLEAYHAYVRRLDDHERACYYADGIVSSTLYGAFGAPASQEEIDALFDAVSQRLEPSPIVFEFIDIMLRVPFIPRPFGIMQPWLVQAAVEIVPPWIRARLGLGVSWRLQRWQRAAVRRSGALADRIILRSAPAVQACRRLGLPDDYLYASPCGRRNDSRLHDDQ